MFFRDPGNKDGTVTISFNTFFRYSSTCTCLLLNYLIVHVLFCRCCIMYQEFAPGNELNNENNAILKVVLIDFSNKLNVNIL